MIGIGSQGTIEKGKPGLAIGRAFTQTWDYIKITLLAFYKMITGDVSPRNIGGPILIAQMAGQQAQEGVGNFLHFLAVLSINLGVLNLLPVPVLDGGHLLFFLVEAVIRKPVSVRVREMAQQVGICLVGLADGLRFLQRHRAVFREAGRWMRILGVDTSTTTASVALIEDDQLIAEAGDGREISIGLSSARGNHSETVLPLIQAVLDKAECRLADLAAIAIAIGPGSFTGLRIGLALVKGLGLRRQLAGRRRVEPRGASRACASIWPGLSVRCSTRASKKSTPPVFDRRDGILLRRMADRACAITALATLFDPAPLAPPIAFVGAGAERYREELLRMFEGRGSAHRRNWCRECSPRGGAFGA